MQGKLLQYNLCFPLMPLICGNPHHMFLLYYITLVRLIFKQK
jgi:hypothetical protein